MALPVRTQLKYWGIATGIFVLVLWFLGDVILPFVLGGAIAYLLDPVADWLERKGLSRALSVAIITVGSTIVFVLSILLVIPTLIEQAINLFQVAPEAAAKMQVFLTERFPDLVNENSTLRKSLESIGQTIQDKGAQFIETVVSSAASLVNIIVLMVIVPVVAVYMLYDWDHMVAEIDKLLPRDHAPVIRRLAREMDATIASFIRGMGTVCLVLGSYYAIALMLVGLQFGLVVGAFAGLVTFIPYLGAIIGGALAIGLGLFQFWGDWVSIGLVAGIFVVGQMVEGNILTPKLVGSSVGLHPVWLLFALSVFGALFGFVGMLVAVPLAAAIGVLVRFGAENYMDSKLYQGLNGQGTAETEDEPAAIE
ncbi:MAG: AI-2E family transporter [Pseudomonadota bacterium]